MGRAWLALGAFLCALGVAVAAFGAHALEGRLAPEDVELWELAGRYLLYGGFGLCLIGLVAYQRMVRAFDNAGLALFLGSLIFSSTVAALALGGPSWLGAVTPVGGTLIILGFLLFAWQAARAG